MAAFLFYLEAVFASGTKSKLTEFIQNRVPVGAGPSLKT